jgi:Uncharacterized conserved protein
MCVAAVAWNAHPDWLFVCAGNRDEFHDRPALPLQRWGDGSGIIAGKDLLGGGTWMGVTESGRFALVTNFRVAEGPRPDRPTRGRLVTGALTGTDPGDVMAMNAFNLISIDQGSASFTTNHPAFEQRSLEPGIYGLSNGGFDVPWPKTLQVQHAVSQWMNSGSPDTSPLLDELRRESLPIARPGADGGPDQQFAPVFIRNPVYGTRCSTVIAVRRDGAGTVIERSFDAAGQYVSERQDTFAWPSVMLR